MSEASLAAKQAVIDEIKENIQKADSVTLVEYQGISVQDITELRQQYRQNQVIYKVYKNTLVKRALEDLGVTGYEEVLTGPNALVFSQENAVTGPKLSLKFQASHPKNFSIKAGILDGDLISEKEVKQLAELPSQEQLYALVVGAAQAPISGLAGALNGLLSKLVYALDEVKDKKEKEAA